MADVLVPISVGELVDKVTILGIKQRLISEPQKLAHVTVELSALTEVCNQHNIDLQSDLVLQLEAINLRLWHIEDDIRDKERERLFDAEFIALARSVYTVNDERAAVKAKINLTSGSRLHEAKSYRDYR